jgi:hypothetical protein
MVSGGTIYLPSFTQIGSGVHKLLRGTYIETRTHTDSKVIVYAYISFSKEGNYAKVL